MDISKYEKSVVGVCILGQLYGFDEGLKVLGFDRISFASDQLYVKAFDSAVNSNEWIVQIYKRQEADKKRTTVPNDDILTVWYGPAGCQKSAKIPKDKLATYFEVANMLGGPAYIKIEQEKQVTIKKLVSPTEFFNGE